MYKCKTLEPIVDLTDADTLRAGPARTNVEWRTSSSRNRPLWQIIYKIRFDRFFLTFGPTTVITCEIFQRETSFFFYPSVLFLRDTSPFYAVTYLRFKS